MVSVLRVVLPSLEVLPGVEVWYICYRTAESEWSAELVTLAFVSFSLNLEPDCGSASRFIVSVPGRRLLPRLLCLQLGSPPSLEDRLPSVLKGKAAACSLGSRPERIRHNCVGTQCPGLQHGGSCPGSTPQDKLQATRRLSPSPLPHPLAGSKLGQSMHLFTVRDAV